MKYKSITDKYVEVCRVWSLYIYIDDIYLVIMCDWEIITNKR